MRLFPAELPWIQVVDAPQVMSSASEILTLPFRTLIPKLAVRSAATPREPPNVEPVAPVSSVAAPVTLSVPATAVFPLAEATVNLEVATEKSPEKFDAPEETRVG